MAQLQCKSKPLCCALRFNYRLDVSRFRLYNRTRKYKSSLSRFYWSEVCLYCQIEEIGQNFSFEFFFFGLEQDLPVKVNAKLATTDSTGQTNPNAKRYFKYYRTAQLTARGKPWHRALMPLRITMGCHVTSHRFCVRRQSSWAWLRK